MKLFIRLAFVSCAATTALAETGVSIKDGGAIAAEELDDQSGPPDLRALDAEPVPGVESSGYGWRRDPFHKRKKFHRGADYPAKHGTPVHAAGTGVVTFAGRHGGYGRVIMIAHNDGVETRYAHLSKIGVKKGQTVQSGSAIGRIGSSGRSTGPHLHFEVRLDGRAVDPQTALDLAELQRTDPEAAKSAMRALDEDVQENLRDPHSEAPRGVDKALW